MAAVPQKVLNWLYSVLTSDYKDTPRAYNDVALALSTYSSFSPRTEVYTYENGQPALLLQISGTIPVVYRGATYRFPLTLWIPHAYPREAPLVFVIPTQGMAIRPSQYVSREGRIYHPYLAGWADFWDKSNLVDFLAIVRDIFAKEPPLRAVLEQGPASPAAPSPAPPVPPLPWHNQQASSSRSESASTSRGQQSPPPPPPKTRNGVSSLSPSNDERPRGPPLPPLPTQVSSSRPAPFVQAISDQQRYEQSETYISANNRGRPSIAQFQSQPQSYSGRYSPVSPISSQDQDQFARGRYDDRQIQSLPSLQDQRSVSIQNERAPTSASTSQRMPVSGHPQQQHRQQMQHYQTVPHQAPQNPVQTVPNLLDTPTDLIIAQPSNLPVPPVPPNPEKDFLLNSIGKALFQQRQASKFQMQQTLQSLEVQHSAMANASTRMQAEIDELDALSATLSSNEKILNESMQKAEQVMADARTREVPQVDDVLVAPTAIASQLYSLVAEEKAIADTIFVLSRAMDKGRIGFDTFLKNTRSLAREQFLKKALIDKIAGILGLDRQW